MSSFFKKKSVNFVYQLATVLCQCLPAESSYVNKNLYVNISSLVTKYSFVNKLSAVESVYETF